VRDENWQDAVKSMRPHDAKVRRKPTCLPEVKSETDHLERVRREKKEVVRLLTRLFFFHTLFHVSQPHSLSPRKIENISEKQRVGRHNDCSSGGTKNKTKSLKWRFDLRADGFLINHANKLHCRSQS